MRDLHLHVKAEYFHEIKSGRKQEEYRLFKDYWKNRLFHKYYDNVIIYLGYPRKDEKDKVLVFPYKGFEVKTITHKQFGNKPVRVFAIKVVSDE